MDIPMTPLEGVSMSMPMVATRPAVRPTRRSFGADLPFLGSLLTETGTPGAAVAVLRGGTQVSVTVAGRRWRDGPAMDPDVIFEAASLTKPVIARLVMELHLRGI